MTLYIVTTVVAVGMLGIVLPVVLHWGKQLKKQQNQHHRQS